MFLGAMLSASEMEAVKAFMNPELTEKRPTFYGSKPNEAMQKEFGAVISPHLLGAAEVLAESNHPLYADVAAACAQRLPLSVVKNMCAGII